LSATGAPAVVVNLGLSVMGLPSKKVWVDLVAQTHSSGKLIDPFVVIS
jgi:hypothetical protein